jgi:(3S)-malyl-CoA thioesterase
MVGPFLFRDGRARFAPVPQGSGRLASMRLTSRARAASLAIFLRRSTFAVDSAAAGEIIGTMSRPVRSVLYLPASNARALDKARGLPCDGIIFDLEDAVAPEAKAEARHLLAAALREGGYGERLRLVRVNGLDTPWGAADLAAAARMEADGVLVPKTGAAADLDAVAGRVPDLPLWAMIETSRGVLNAAAIAAHPRLAGIVMGTNDLARELNARPRADRRPLLPALGMAVLAARAAGKVALDGVFNDLSAAQAFLAECVEGRDLGFDGKTLIHPGQIAAANTAFGPAAEDIALARRQIAAFEEAQAAGRGVAVLDGRLVENLHVATARAILARAAAIAERGSA